MTHKTLTLLAALTLLCGLAACESDPADPGTGDTAAPVSDMIEDATLQRCDGTEISLADYIAQREVTYIAFAAGWCIACVEEIPTINAQITDHFDAADAGAVQILIEGQAGIPPSLELCAGWETDSPTPNYDILVDIPQYTIDSFFGGVVAQLPSHRVVTRDGTIRYELTGAVPPDLQQIVSDWVP